MATHAYTPITRPIFRDASLQAAFADGGAVCRRVIDEDAAAALLAQVIATIGNDSLAPPNEAAGYKAYMARLMREGNGARLSKLHELAVNALQPAVDELLVDYRILSTVLFVKPPSDGALALHRDWTLQEDYEWPTINLWCSLTEADARNGALQLVPDSFRMFDYMRPANRELSITCDDQRIDRYVETWPTRPGEAILFDPSMYHGSGPNSTDTARIALAVVCIPRSRRPIVHAVPEGNPEVVETYSWDTSDILDDTSGGFVFGRFKSEKLAVGSLRLPDYSVDDAIAIIEQADAIRTGEATLAQVVAHRREGANAQSTPRMSIYRRIRAKAGRVLRRVRAIVTPDAEPDFAPYPALPQPWQPFGDAQLNAALQENGFATMPFLTPDEVDGLADVIGAAEQQLDRGDVHIPTRFMLSAFSNDSVYKERLYNSVWEYLQSRVAEILPGYEPLVVNVFDKPPSDAYDPVPIHQNPSFVDEPTHKSVSLWIPLCDVDRSNGTVGVLPGSHNRFNTMRAGNMAHEEIFADVQVRLENELFVPVDMIKGEMLALDDSILHWSYPNVSAARRKAVQLIMVPKGVPHIYYFYDDEGPGDPMMDRYKVDRHFFFGFNCKARPETLEHIDRVPWRYRRIAEAELLAAPSSP